MIKDWQNDLLNAHTKKHGAATHECSRHYLKEEKMINKNKLSEKSKSGVVARLLPLTQGAKAGGLKDRS